MFKLPLRRAKPAFRHLTMDEARRAVERYIEGKTVKEQANIRVGDGSVEAWRVYWEVDRLTVWYERTLLIETRFDVPVAWPTPKCGIEELSLANARTSYESCNSMLGDDADTPNKALNGLCAVNIALSETTAWKGINLLSGFAETQENDE